MKEWQSEINSSVQDSIVKVIRELREQNPNLAFGLNYNLLFPNKFVPGAETPIPVTVPSNQGLFKLGDVVVSTDLDSSVTGISLNVNQTVSLFDRANYQDGSSGPETLIDTLGVLGDFFDSLLGTLRSDQMKRLLTPPGGQLGVGGETQVNTAVYDRGSAPVRVINNGIGAYNQQQRTVPWSQINTSHRKAEAAKAENITTKEQRIAFIEEALDSPSHQPQWFAALGGTQRRTMKEKIAKAYTDKCSDIGKTIIPTDFLEAVRKSLATEGKLTPYCTAANKRVEGSPNNTCENKSCSIYTPNCPRFSYRLRTDLL